MSDLQIQRCVSKALEQVDRVAGVCRFLQHPAIKAAIEESVPCTMPQTPGGLGFDVPFWMGLGVVGLWSALDAFAEEVKLPTKPRCPICNLGSCLYGRFTAVQKFAANEIAFLEELGELRHLHAHNFAGHIDRRFLNHRARHLVDAFSHPPKRSFACGAVFDGRSVPLDVPHLRYYCDRARDVLEKYR